ncbi:tautomerase family protein [Mycobacterium sp. ACS4331]|uniref:tautomerase family protein n=1 Tax=Mycobacterium sp. ACS4331 TaxID=1834121 RepID=UPI0007FE63F5|nr:tautomerase family protein [Mycobacterium sp. ACS4331]OBF16225.1 4-oxalocrotonate tautomerase [Mycobacterium sp. ACS4331]
MPLWTIHHTPGVFTDADKKELSERITDRYAEAGLPRFYVVTVFNEIPHGDMYVGGVAPLAGVRVVIDHIARHAADRAHRHRIAHWVNTILDPYLSRHPGLHSEFHIDETSEDLWMINGLIPPPARSEAEQRWVRENAASPY